MHDAPQYAGDPLAAFYHAFWWAVGVTALALVACLWLPGRRLAPAPVASGEAAAELVTEA